MNPSNPAYDLRFVFETELRPLVKRIEAICDEHKLPFALYFQNAVLFADQRGFNVAGYAFGATYDRPAPVIQKIGRLIHEAPNLCRASETGYHDGASAASSKHQGEAEPTDAAATVLADLILEGLQHLAQAEQPKAPTAPTFGVVGIRKDDLRAAFEKGGEQGVSDLIRDSVMSHFLDRTARGRA